MNQVEGDAKPILEKILREESHDISETDQAVLAKWICLKSIVSEHSQQNEYVTTSDERSQLRASGAIPWHFRIYLGRYTDSDGTAFVRRSALFSASEKGPSPPIETRSRNVQTIAFMVGELFVFVVSARTDIDLVSFLDDAHLATLWPMKNASIKWPLPTVPQNVLANTAHWLEDMIRHPKVRYMGDLP